MRILAATLALMATVLCALLAGGYLLSSRYTASAAAIRLRTRTDQLRAASEQLLDPDALAARRASAIKLARAKAKAKAAAAPAAARITRDGAAVASRHRTLGIALAVGTGLGLVAVLLLFFNRARKTALVGVAVGAAAGIFGLMLEGFVVLFAVIAGLQLLALLLAWRAKGRKPKPKASSAPAPATTSEPDPAEAAP